MHPEPSLLPQAAARTGDTDAVAADAGRPPTRLDRRRGHGLRNGA
jgi:hypothetical protein